MIEENEESEQLQVDERCELFGVLIETGSEI